MLSVKALILFAIAMTFDTAGNILLKQGMNRFVESTLTGWRSYWANIKGVLSAKILPAVSNAMAIANKINALTLNIINASLRQVLF